MAARMAAAIVQNHAVAAGRRLLANVHRRARWQPPVCANCGNWIAIFARYWPLRNKGTIEKCAAFLRWRIDDYQRGILHYPPDVAKVAQPKTYAAE